MVGEALNQCVDITIKRKQLLQSLTEAKIPPQIDEKVRKSIKEVCFLLRLYFNLHQGKYATRTISNSLKNIL